MLAYRIDELWLGVAEILDGVSAIGLLNHYALPVVYIDECGLHWYLDVQFGSSASV